MRNFGLAVTVFAMSFTLSAIAFVQTNKSSNQKQSPTKTQAAKQTASKQEVRCPVSGKVITDTKKAPKYAYRGKTYYFNCQSCLAEFKKNPDKYVKQAAAMRTVSNTPAKKEGESCCNSAEKAASASCCSGEKQATANASCCSDKKDAQTTQTAAAAPANKLICPVSGEEITEADAVRFTYNGKVYYTCCNGCKGKFLKDPETYAKKAEQLSALQGKPEKADTN